jgi:N-acetylneuraminate lyase
MSRKPMRLTGLVAAPYTPFYPNGSLNVEVIGPMAEFMIDAGVNGVFICGSTGEGHSLLVDERQAVAEAWVNAAQGRIPVIVHVGHNSLFDAITLARHAEAIGADAISSLAPSYYKPRTMRDLLAFLAALAASAPALPFYYYHIPSMTGVTLPVAELLKLGSLKIPTLNGLKFSHNDFMELQECLALNGGEFDVVYGVDEMMLAGLAFGVNGFVGSTYNFASPLYNRVIESFQKGDFATARREQRKSVELVRTLYEFGLMRAGKAVMSLLGVDCGPVRSPLDPIPAEEVRELALRLRHLDIFAAQIRLPRPKRGKARSGRETRREPS